MKGLLAEFTMNNQYDLTGSADIVRNTDGIPIESEQYPASKPDLTPLKGWLVDEMPKAKDTNCIKALTVAGVEQHLAINQLITGNEAFDLEGLKGGLASVYDHVKFATGESYKFLSNGFNKLTRAMLTAYGTRKQALYVLKRDLDRNGINATVGFSSTYAASLTTTGKPNDFIPDINILLKELESLKKHSQSVNEFLEKTLGIVKAISTIDSTQKAVSIIDKYDDLGKPIWLLPHRTTDTIAVSEVLPGGKVFKFEHDRKGHVRYSMSGDKPSGESHSDSMSKDQLDKGIESINKVNEYLSYFAKQLNVYLALVKRWGDAVKASSGKIESADLSGSLKSQLDKIMDGPEDYLLFYSGFLPKVISYTDRYVQDAIGLGGKLIN